MRGVRGSRALAPVSRPSVDGEWPREHELGSVQLSLPRTPTAMEWVEVGIARYPADDLEDEPVDLVTTYHHAGNRYRAMQLTAGEARQFATLLLQAADRSESAIGLNQRKVP